MKAKTHVGIYSSDIGFCGLPRVFWVVQNADPSARLAKEARQVRCEGAQTADFADTEVAILQGGGGGPTLLAFANRIHQLGVGVPSGHAE
jgi:hypothetical protein